MRRRAVVAVHATDCSHRNTSSWIKLFIFISSFYYRPETDAVGKHRRKNANTPQNYSPFKLLSCHSLWWVNILLSHGSPTLRPSSADLPARRIIWFVNARENVSLSNRNLNFCRGRKNLKFKISFSSLVEIYLHFTLKCNNYLAALILDVSIENFNLHLNAALDSWQRRLFWPGRSCGEDGDQKGQKVEEILLAFVWF